MAAVLAYFGSVAWLYEARVAGKLLLVLLTVVTLAGAMVELPAFHGMVRHGEDWTVAKPAFCIVPRHADSSTDLFGERWARPTLLVLDPITSGLLLGTTIAAMFLGHWYLNTPTMELAPLKRLIILMAMAILFRAIVCGAGLGYWLSVGGSSGITQYSLIALRWLSGILGAAIVAVMAWQTLKIPNTQSATGILYVGVIVTFLGELTSQLLSAGSPFPL